MGTEAFEQIVEDFELLDEWEDRYRYVIDLGKAMAPLDDALRSPATKVEGCASQVWIAPRMDGEGAEAAFEFDGDSDAMIVRGLIAVLHSLYAGLRPGAVLEVDAPRELGRLGLDQHLSSQRSNGVRAMVQRIEAIARTSLQKA